MGATIKDIAKYTGLSLGTVSNYLNGIPVKEVNQTLIDEAISALNYKVNYAARSLRTNKSYVIGFIIPSLELTFSIKFLTVIEEELASQGYTVAVCVIKGRNQLEDERKLDNLLQQRIDGLIVFPPANNKELQSWLHSVSMTIPTIVLDRILEQNLDCQHITINNREAAYLATDYLLTMGYRNIAVILGDQGGYTSDERLRGFMNALSDRKLQVPDTHICYGNFNRKAGYKAFKQLMALKEPPSAVFITNYDMTLGALEYTNENQLVIGEDVSLIGFDLDELIKLFTPRLAMVIQPVEEIGEYVTENILALVKGENGSKEHLEFPCRIDWGASVKKRGEE